MNSMMLDIIEDDYVLFHLMIQAGLNLFWYCDILGHWAFSENDVFDGDLDTAGCAYREFFFRL